jgi:hypothetical protein
MSMLNHSPPTHNLGYPPADITKLVERSQRIQEHLNSETSNQEKLPDVSSSAPASATATATIAAAAATSTDVQFFQDVSGDLDPDWTMWHGSQHDEDSLMQQQDSTNDETCSISSGRVWVEDSLSYGVGSDIWDTSQADLQSYLSKNVNATSGGYRSSFGQYWDDELDSGDNSDYDGFDTSNEYEFNDYDSHFLPEFYQYDEFNNTGHNLYGYFNGSDADSGICLRYDGDDEESIGGGVWMG